MLAEIFDFVGEVTITNALGEETGVPNTVEVGSFLGQNFARFFNIFQSFQTTEISSTMPSSDSLASFASSASMVDINTDEISSQTNLSSFFAAFGQFQTVSHSHDSIADAPAEMNFGGIENTDLFKATDQFLQTCPSSDNIHLDAPEF
jgi:hypothetical protein